MKKFFSHLKKYCFQYIIFFLCFVICFVTLDSYKKSIEVQTLRQEIVSCQSFNNDLQQINDSMHDEIFILENEMTRHEITREYIFYVYPQVGREYDEYISNYTE